MATGTDDSVIPLADDFATGSREDWLNLVEKALRGRPAEPALVRSTYEGVSLNSLYHGNDRVAAHTVRPVIDEVAAANRIRHGWDIRQLHLHPDPETANADIRADLEGGAGSVALQLDRGARCLHGDRYYDDGLVVRRADDLDRVLAGVDLGRTAVALKPGAAGPLTAALLLAVAARRDVASANLSGILGIDPIGALAADGELPGPMEQQLQSGAELAGWCTGSAPRLRTFCFDTDIWHAAGATEVEDLAIAMGSAVAALRVMTAHGLNIDEACRQVAFTVTATPDVFQTIAKFRAACRLWHRVLEVCGASAPDTQLGAITASRSLARRDPWVNQLRATCSCIGAGIGGADSITVRSHTDALGPPSPMARRVARNIQTILVQESSLARVIDPAAGSYFVEQLTESYAKRAWSTFQDIEAAGGMVPALVSGRIAEMLEASWTKRARNLARRRDPVTGVSSFPNLDEEPGATRPVDQDAVAAIIRAAGDDAGNAGADRFDVAGLVAAAEQGASLVSLAGPLAGAVQRIPPLRQHRLGEDFEALRDASDAWRRRNGAFPLALLACLGTPADFSARAVFARNYLAAGGIAAQEQTVEPETISSASFSTARLAVICSSDDVYAAAAEAAARALRAAGVRLILLAGRPGRNEASLRDAGINGFIYQGDDTLATLRGLAIEIGMIKQ